jgi:hypothetical protein
MTDSKWDFWMALAGKWESVLDSYIRKSYINEELHEDLPYWHSEKASTGFLAAAAWMSGAIAIEEFYTKRFDENTQKTSEGHCDLWVKYKDFSFSAEAKQLRPSVYQKEAIEEKIKEAEGQLSSLSSEDKEASSFLFSICFISPILKDRKDFGEFLKNIKENFNDQNYFRVFHYDGRYLADNIINYYKNRPNENWPGFVMLIKDSTNKCKQKVSVSKR